MQAAADADGDQWEVFTAFMRRIVDAEVHAITIRLAGTFIPTDDLLRDATKATELNELIVARAKAAGGLRPDIEVDDLSLIFEQLAAIRLGDERRTRELRHRYLSLFLDGLRPGRDELPGPPPAPEELVQRWYPRSKATGRS